MSSQIVFAVPCIDYQTMTSARKSRNVSNSKKKKTVKPKKQPIVCKFQGCTFKCKKNCILKEHIRSHTGEKPYKCDFPECIYSCAQKSNLKVHQRIHSGEKPFQCDFEDCDYSCTTASGMVMHERKHTGHKPFKCDVEGCTYRSTKSDHMVAHKRSHDGVKPYLCDFIGCDYSSVTGSQMTDHKRTHTGEKPYVCNFTGCDFRSAQRSNLTEHERTHLGLKEFNCDMEGCTFVCSTNSSLTKHKRLHSTAKPFGCDILECNASFKQKSHLTRHKQRYHTKEGMNRKKIHEERLRKFLKQHYAVDEEVHIRYKDGCVPNPDKYCSRVDFGVVEITSAVVIVECDEWKHESYLTSCECSRMEQTSEAIIKSGDTRPIVYIRFNPNDTYTVDGVVQKANKKSREEQLLLLLKKIQAEEIAFDLPLNIIYMYYDMEDGVPAVCGDPDYSEQLKGCIFQPELD